MTAFLIQFLLILFWILVSIIAAVILILVLIMFWPFQYQLAFEKTDALLLFGKVKWLFGLVTASIAYPDWKSVKIRLAGVLVFDTACKKSLSAPMKQQDTMQAANASDQNENTEVQSITSSNAEAPGNSTQHASTDSSSSDTSPKDGASKVQDSDPAHDSALQKKPLVEKVKNLYQKFLSYKADFLYYKKLLTKEVTKRLFYDTFHRVKKILKYMKPRKMEGWLHIGTGSPDSTGYLMAVYGILLAFWGKTIRFEPDFEKQVFHGNIKISGSILIAPILYQAIRILLDRRLRIFIKKIKREEHNNGGKR